jgi:hypothetical protein
MTEQLPQSLSSASLLRVTCREATALVVAREDWALNELECQLLTKHLATCQSCVLLERQMLVMREAFGLLRAYQQESLSALRQIH